ncbi:uncharacterized protein LOC106152480 [Lingula anatina]|uniref:Uncharacterized protein LOC106152480 n=1 Tax=Lingula anatina TaxID=7574 RepID=A0A1S3H7S7_LINAN|nr:uncharacterized protein LOC106152480 [Lingula anatina]|eukprot:XP_013381541.1 uncharacterized protein LOC106152480 [Lingula anatina]
MQFDSQNRPIPVEEFNSSHTHRKVAINLPKKYHLMRVLSGTRTSQETRQLEILGYKVVMLFPKIWESYHLWRQQEFLRQAISDMGHNSEGEGHLKDLNEENYLQE